MGGNQMILMDPEIKSVAVLDKGFVTLVDWMGNDLTPVNAARISFGKRKTVFDEKDAELIKYLAEHEHTAPFRHASVTFHIKAPIFVMRQWMKHRIASEFNELSGRYVEFKPEFYIPGTFRLQAKVNKQGSEGAHPQNDLMKQLYGRSLRSSFDHYEELLRNGVCREQARCVLPMATYTEVYWTVSLHALAHFLHLRTDAHAQWEIQQFAHAVEKLASQLFPLSLAALRMKDKHDLPESEVPQH